MPDIAAHQEFLTRARIPHSIGADRFCLQCGTNLIGRSVMLDERTGMLLVRCPKCAAPAVVQANRRLEFWNDRGLMLLLVVWLIALLGMFVLTAFVTTAFTIAMSEACSTGYRDVIEDAWQQHPRVVVNVPAVMPGGTVIHVPARRSEFEGFKTWWTSLDHDAFLADAGGVFRVIDKRNFLILLPMGLLAGAFGVVVSMLMPRVRLPGRVVWAGAIVVIAIVPIILEMMAISPTVPHRAARIVITPVIAPVTLAFIAMCLVIGQTIGRPLIRKIMWYVIPPSRLQNLAWFWTVNDVEPPRSG